MKVLLFLQVIGFMDSFAVQFSSQWEEKYSAVFLLLGIGVKYILIVEFVGLLVCLLVCWFNMLATEFFYRSHIFIFSHHWHLPVSFLFMKFYHCHPDVFYPRE